MTAALRIVQPGLRATVQDAGRPGWRRWGVPVCGAADAPLWRVGCAVAGGPADAAAVEFALSGPTLRAEGGPVRVALAGAASGRLTRADGSVEALPPWRSATLAPGETLAVGAVEAGLVGYVCVGGGLDLAPILGARATDLRAGFGGLDGRMLAAGDRLPVAGPPPEGPERVAAAPPPPAAGPLRIIPGPQDDHFTAQALASFAAADWRVGDQVDRMGARLTGPRLAHGPRGADIMSEGMAIGAVQVPGDGQPIVLGVDSATIGGYPKIATVIAADIPRIGQLAPGAVVRFVPVSLEQARAAARAAAAALAAAIASVGPWRGAGGVDLDALNAANLVSGAVDARRPAFPGALEGGEA